MIVWRNSGASGILPRMVLGKRFFSHRMFRASRRLLLPGVLLLPGLALAAGAAQEAAFAFPRPVATYAESPDTPVLQVLRNRIAAEPFNLVPTIIFLCAVAHTFLAPVFLRMAHRFEQEHRRRQAQPSPSTPAPARPEASLKAEVFHFLGEVEAVFGLWVVPLILAITFSKGWPAARDYFGHGLVFTEALFVVVVMSIASSRPILRFSEQVMALAASLGRGSPTAWWISILTLGPILGSFITEPAAMTISALLLGEKFYQLKPKAGFAYATLGLLFVNVSVGGTLTHFAAPPVLMVAGKWGWDLPFMFTHFGWKAIVGMLAANLCYWFYFRREFKAMASAAPPTANGQSSSAAPIPPWVTLVHILFLVWTVANNHYPPLFLGGFLFYLAFTRVTEHHQDALNLRPALMVGFFLAGLVAHGGLQGWWIAPVLDGLSKLPMFFGAVVLTAFNDNAAITYLASFVPNPDPTLRYLVVAGAVTGGGLTVIANAPNPAGQSILSRFFPDGISAFRLFLGALLPTILLAAAFLLLAS